MPNNYEETVKNFDPITRQTLLTMAQQYHVRLTLKKETLSTMITNIITFSHPNILNLTILRCVNLDIFN